MSLPKNSISLKRSEVRQLRKAHHSVCRSVIASPAAETATCQLLGGTGSRRRASSAPIFQYLYLPKLKEGQGLRRPVVRSGDAAHRPGQRHHSPHVLRLDRSLCSAESRCDLTQQFLRANIHGAARREHLALLSGNRLATHADGFSRAAAAYCPNPGARVPSSREVVPDCSG